jgi:hypothetical protein
MKHSTEELIFAALLRERIGSLRLSKIGHMSDEETEAFDREPVNALIEEAMKELNGIATLVKKIQERKPPAETPA